MGIQEDEQVNPHTKGCKECEKEDSNWLALRMCLTCGHVRCCDSSPGIHVTKHYEKYWTFYNDCTARQIMEMVLYT